MCPFLCSASACHHCLPFWAVCAVALALSLALATFVVPIHVRRYNSIHPRGVPHVIDHYLSYLQVRSQLSSMQLKRSLQLWRCQICHDDTSNVTAKELVCSGNRTWQWCRPILHGLSGLQQLVLHDSTAPSAAHGISSLLQVRSVSSTCATPRIHDCPRTCLAMFSRSSCNTPTGINCSCAFVCLSSRLFTMRISVVLSCAVLVKSHQKA